MANEDDEVVELLQHAAREVTGREIPGLTPETHLAAAGIDLVAVLEMVGCIEDRIGLRLPDDEIARVGTVADVGALIARARRAAEVG